MVRSFKVIATASLAATLWVVPSVGTQGQGTLGDRFVHADHGLVRDDAAGRRLLVRADHQVVAAVAGL